MDKLLSENADALIPGMKFPDSPKVVLNLQEFQSAWHSDNRVYVLVPESRIDALELDGHEMMRIQDRVLVRNH